MQHSSTGGMGGGGGQNSAGVGEFATLANHGETVTSRRTADPSAVGLEVESQARRRLPPPLHLPHSLGASPPPAPLAAPAPPAAAPGAGAAGAVGGAAAPPAEREAPAKAEATAATPPAPSPPSLALTPPGAAAAAQGGAKMAGYSSGWCVASQGLHLSAKQGPQKQNSGGRVQSDGTTSRGGGEALGPARMAHAPRAGRTHAGSIPPSPATRWPPCGARCARAVVDRCSGGGLDVQSGHSANLGRRKRRTQ
jgi:hypothetical protein